MVRQTKLILLFVLLLGLGGYFFFSRHPCTTFSRAIVCSSLPPQAKWSIPPPTAKKKKRLQSILSQKFTFLGEGAQAIAFQSEDGRYVLKLFRMRRFTPSTFDQLCPHVVRRRLRNLEWVFNGYKNAYTDLRQETGLIWIHLAKTNEFHQTITLADQNGKEHVLDVDETEFALQKQAELLFTRLERLYREGKKEEAEKSIASVLQLVKSRIEKGYADRDKAVSFNYGFVGDRPIQLDLGRLYKGHREKQLEHVERRIERWKSEHLEELNCESRSS